MKIGNSAVVSLALFWGVFVLWGAAANGGTQEGGRGYGGRPSGSYTVTCSSDNGRRNYCNADTRGGVQLLRQRSGSPCRQGYSWGYDRNGIWVDRGCRADFQVMAYNSGGYNRPGRPYPGGAPQMITCSSDDGRRHYCDADTSRGVRLVNQRSGSPCRQGSTWGYDRRGIWVDRGCRADFAVGPGR